MTSAVSSFLDWWRDELATFVPARVHGLFEHHQNEIRAEIRDGLLRLLRDDGSGIRELAVLTPATPASEQDRQRVQQALAALPGKAPRVALALPAEQTLSRILAFPAAAEENLRQVVAYEMPRRTPFDPDEVYFDVEIVDRAAEDGALTVALYVVPRQTVDDAVAALTALGLRPDRVGISSVAGRSAANINFLPAMPQGRGRRLEKATAAALAVLTVALLIAAIVLPLERKRDLSVRLTDQVAAMRKQVATVTHLEQEIKEATLRNRFIATERNGSPPAVAVMDDLTKLLPDDTWLFQMHLKDGHVSMQGYTNAVSALVELIESSPHFRNVTVQSNITRDQKTGQERFHVTFDIKAGGG